MSSIRTSSLGREVRHPLWTPTNYDGSSPQLGGTGANAPGSWQPVGVGQNDYRDGDATDFRLFKADSGSKFILSGFSKKDTIEDDTGDGDSAVQMRSRVFTVPGGRQASFIVPASLGLAAEVPRDRVQRLAEGRARVRPARDAHQRTDRDGRGGHVRGLRGGLHGRHRGRRGWSSIARIRRHGDDWQRRDRLHHRAEDLDDHPAHDAPRRGASWTTTTSCARRG